MLVKEHGKHNNTTTILKDEMTLKKVGALYPYTMNPYMVYEP